MDYVFSKKEHMCQIIDSENGKNFHKNVDLSGYTFYKDESFISFKIMSVEGVRIVYIKYIYATSREALVSLMAYCVNFWAGNQIKFIYYLEHKRNSAYAIKFLKKLGFRIVEEKRPGVWKHDFDAIEPNNKEVVFEATV